MLATRLWATARSLRPARAGDSRFRRRLVYGGHIISTSALLNMQEQRSGSPRSAPAPQRRLAFAGDLIHAWSRCSNASTCPATSIGAAAAAAAATAFPLRRLPAAPGRTSATGPKVGARPRLRC